MAIETDAQLKTYFEAGDKPTEGQFINLIDSKINIQNIVDNLNSTDTNKPLSANQGKVLGDAQNVIEKNVAGNLHTVNSANYTILDDDGYKTIVVTAGASDRTITLPTLADNQKRELIIIKIDAGAGNVIIDGEGGEFINGALTETITSQYGVVRFIATSTMWVKI